MKKVSAVVAASILLSGLAVSASPALATPADKVTICHATGSDTNPYNVITVSENSLKKGHSLDKGDIIPATPECIALDATPEPEIEPDVDPVETEPVETEPSDPVVGSSQKTEYVCDATGNYELIVTTVTRASGTESISRIVGRTLTEEEVLVHCKPVPGDLIAPVIPTETAPVDNLESYPAPAPVPNTVNGTPPASTQPVPAAPAPVQAAATKPAELANTGAKEGLILWTIVGLLALAAGIFSVVRVRRNA